MDYMIHGILQVRILEWVAFHFQRSGGDVSTKGQRITILGSAGHHVHPTYMCSAYSTWTICDNWVGPCSVKPDLSKQAAGQIRQQSPSSAALHCPDSLPWLPPLPLLPMPCVCIPTSSINSPYSSWPRSKVCLLHESCASKAASSSGSHNTLSVPCCAHHFLPHNSLSQHAF